MPLSKGLGWSKQGKFFYYRPASQDVKFKGECVSSDEVKFLMPEVLRREILKLVNKGHFAHTDYRRAVWEMLDDYIQYMKHQEK
jgi:hypothetical protein